MKWQGRRGSSNIRDLRRSGSGRSTGADVGGAGGVGVLAIVVIGYFLGVDLTPILGACGGVRGSCQAQCRHDGTREDVR